MSFGVLIRKSTPTFLQFFPLTKVGQSNAKLFFAPEPFWCICSHRGFGHVGFVGFNGLSHMLPNPLDVADVKDCEPALKLLHCRDFLSPLQRGEGFLKSSTHTSTGTTGIAGLSAERLRLCTLSAIMPTVDLI
mmetsp:Transcript_79626/g.132986  ORF Transcript_79626/g.132986 Transcript_79626/m.132986 type:complete len:133 (+) Transcript_79626:44-442(+)